jgi:hypothetical protein
MGLMGTGMGLDARVRWAGLGVPDGIGTGQNTTSGEWGDTTSGG